MKTKPIAHKRIWPEWDAELNRFGEWLLLGCFASASLPPVPGLLGLVALLYVGLMKIEPKAEALFSRRRVLMDKEKAGTITSGEAIQLDRLLGHLRRTEKKRDTRIYWIALATMILTMFYIDHKLFSLPLRHWFL